MQHFFSIYDLISDLTLDLDKQMNEKLIRVKRNDEPIPKIAIEPQMCICNKCPGTYVLIYLSLMQIFHHSVKKNKSY